MKGLLVDPERVDQATEQTKHFIQSFLEFRVLRDICQVSGNQLLGFQFTQRTSRHIKEMPELLSGHPGSTFGDIAGHRYRGPAHLAREIELFIARK